MPDGTLDERVAALELAIGGHVAVGDERRKNIDAQFSHFDRKCHDHEGRLRVIETWKNTLVGKLALAAWLGSLVGGALVALVVHFVTG